MIASLYRNKLVRYGVIGGVSTLIHTGIAFGWLYALNNSLIAANIAGFMVAYLFSYTIQSLLVFEHSLSVPKAVRYFIVQFTALWLSMGLSTLLERSPYIKTLLIVVAMPLITYTIHRFWTFEHR